MSIEIAAIPFDSWPRGRDGIVIGWLCSGPENRLLEEGSKGQWFPVYINKDREVCGSESWEPEHHHNDGTWQVTYVIDLQAIPEPEAQS